MSLLDLLWTYVLVVGVLLFVVGSARRPRRLGWAAAAMIAAVLTRNVATGIFALKHVPSVAVALLLVGSAAAVVLVWSARRILERAPRMTQEAPAMLRTQESPAPAIHV